jgi:hypothetical protein
MGERMCLHCEGRGRVQPQISQADVTVPFTNHFNRRAVDRMAKTYRCLPCDGTGVGRAEAALDPKG